VLLLSAPRSSIASWTRSDRRRAYQVIFDLAGITEYSGIDAFRPLPCPIRSRLITDCYSPEMWDIIRAGTTRRRAGSISPGPDGLRRTAKALMPSGFARSQPIRWPMPSTAGTI